MRPKNQRTYKLQVDAWVYADWSSDSDDADTWAVDKDHHSNH